LPFMPEMLRYCGKTMRVGKRAHKTCDPALGIGGRKMESTVHLENIRCDGSAHDGCEAGCLIFWKEAWLRRVESGPATQPSASKASSDSQTSLTNQVSTGNEARVEPSQCTEETLASSVKIPSAAGDSTPIYTCQNTQIKFATQPLSPWDV